MLSESYTFLGIELNGKFSSLQRTTNVCRKARNAYFAVANIRNEHTNPLVLIQLYKSVVLPILLYGCEVWNDIKGQDINLLNILQHFVVKNVQRFKPKTRSDICESMVGLRNIICEIDKRKLLFFGKLCSLENKFLAKQVLLQRLYTCLPDCSKRSGFIPDIIKIMLTYELSEVLNQFILEGNFPTKIVWRRSINEAIKVKHDTEWLNRIKTSSDFCRFRDIHSSICIAKIWTFPNNSSELRTAYFVAKLLAKVPVYTEQICGICNRTFDRSRVCKLPRYSRSPQCMVGHYNRKFFTWILFWVEWARQWRVASSNAWKTATSRHMCRRSSIFPSYVILTSDNIFCRL